MRVWTIAIIAGLLFGCGHTFSAKEIREDLDIIGRLVIRGVELKENPTVTTESCASDIQLLDDGAKWLATRIDGGAAAESSAWKKVDGFRELLTTLGCPFVPDLSMYHPERPPERLALLPGVRHAVD